MKDITIEEATKIIKIFIDYFNKNKDDGNKANLCVLGEEIKAIEKVLNELKNKDRTNYALLDALKERTDERDRKDKRIREKDKIINAMALQLSGISIWDNQKEEPIILASEDEVKQYFERKVKDE